MVREAGASACQLVLHSRFPSSQKSKDTDMWFIQPKQDYIPEIPWNHADEPVVMAWQVRARNYNTFISNIFLIPIVCLAIGVGLDS